MPESNSRDHITLLITYCDAARLVLIHWQLQIDTDIIMFYMFDMFKLNIIHYGTQRLGAGTVTVSDISYIELQYITLLFPHKMWRELEFAPFRNVLLEC